MTAVPAFERARAAVHRCDAMLVVGTSGLVFPAAELPRDAARSAAALIVVDPQPTELDRIAAASLRGRAATIVPALLAEPGAAGS